MRRLAITILMCVPWTGYAQQTAAPDSLLLFRAAMEQEAIKEFPPRGPEHFVLVWKEERAGARITHSRGHGSTLVDLLTPDGQLRPEICVPFGPAGITNYGNRYAVVWVSPDTGLARYTEWYFERKP